MDIIDILNQVNEVEKEREKLERKIDNVRYEIEDIHRIEIKTRWPDGLPCGSGTTDPTGELVTSILSGKKGKKYDRLRGKLVDLQIKWYKATETLWNKRMEVCQIISNTPDAKGIKVLRYRYIDGLNWQETADLMGMSANGIRHIHKGAIAALSETIMGKSWENETVTKKEKPQNG